MVRRLLVAALVAVALPALAPASAEGPGYSFFETRSTRAPKVYWNPCQVIRYGIDTTYAQRRGLLRTREVARWRSAVAATARATGLRFRYVGQVRSRAVSGAPAPVQAADIVITYGAASRQGRYGYGRALAGDTAGVSGVVWLDGPGRVSRITRGYVVIDAPDVVAHTRSWDEPFDPTPASRRAPDPLRSLYMHEFGHAVGMGHVRDRKQLMYPQVVFSRPDVWGPGDLKGLRLLGAQPCF